MSEGTVQIATFEVDATPPEESPIAYGTVEGVDDPLSCRGVVLVPDGRPIILAAIDWIGTYNGGHEAWRLALADAADTSPERVAMHAVHQHEAPGFDVDTETMLLAQGTDHWRVDPAFARDTVREAGAALEDAMTRLEPVTHVGVGTGTVEKVASNRQVLGEDGTCCYVRYTGGGPDFDFASSAPEGLVDPELTMVTFWQDDDPLAALSYYATHPQSYYRNGLVTCDFPGIARNRHEEKRETFQVQFTGAAGNVTAGKYNDGSEELRPVLADRVADGMAEAWEATARTQVSTDDVTWEVERVELVPDTDVEPGTVPADPDDQTFRSLAFQRRCDVGRRILIPALHVNDLSVIHGPGELFVEYQLAAKQMRPDRTVAVAAYGDLGPQYVPTAAAYPLGGYEVGSANVAPETESVLTGAFRRLLDAEDDTVTPSDLTAEKPTVSR